MSDREFRGSGGSAEVAPPLIPDHTLLRHIATGAYGEVWLARNAFGIGRAVKIVRRDRFKDRRPYEREYAGIRKYEPVSRSHEGLMDVLQVGPASPVDWFYYVMELADDLPPPRQDPAAALEEGSQPADGSPVVPEAMRYQPRTLHAELEHQGRLPVAQCIQIGRSLSRALEHLHGLGLVHRDLKPSNVIYVGSVPKLSDPGLVAGLMEPASFVGTTGFVAPEGPGQPAADLFSLGRLLYSASTGHEGASFPDPPSDLSGSAERESWSELNAVILRASANEPKARYASAAEMRRDLERIDAGESPRAIRRALERALRFRRWAFITTVSATLLGVLMIWQNHQMRLIRQAREATRQEYRRSLDGNGLRAFASGELPLAALWFFEALKLAQAPSDLERERIRIGTALRMTPALVHEEKSETPFKTVAFSPDGKWIFAGCKTGEAGLWDSVRLQRVTSDLMLGADVEAVSFSPDSRSVATGCADGMIRLWEVPSGWLLASVKAGDRIIKVCFSPDGQRIAAGCDSGGLWLWRAPDLGLIAKSPKHRARIRDLKFSPDGRWLATASSDETARLWNGFTGEEVGGELRMNPTLALPGLEGISAPNQRLRCVAFSQDSRLVAAGGAGAVVQVWNVPSGTPAGPPIGAQQTYWVGFTPNGKQLITAGGTLHTGGEARLWHIANAQPVGPPFRHGHLISQAALSDDGNWLLTASHDHTAKLWNLGQFDWAVSSAPMIHGDRVWEVQFDPTDPSRWITSGRDGSWRVWHLDAPGNCVWSTKGDRYVHYGALSQDATAAAIGYEQSLEVIDVRAEKFLRRFTTAISAKVMALNFSRDGRLLATVQADGVIRVYDARAGQVRGTAVIPKGSVTQCRISPDGRQLVVAQDTNAWLWNLAPPDSVQLMTNCLQEGFRLVHEHNVETAEFDPEGDFLVTGSGNRNSGGPGQLSVWSRATGERRYHDVLPMTAVVIAFSPDHRLVAVGCADNTSNPGGVQLRRTTDWQLQGQLLGHGDGVSCLAFHPRLPQLATGCEDGTIRQWNTQTGALLGVLDQKTGGIRELVYSADGNFLAAAFRYAVIQVWDVATQQPVTPEIVEMAEVTSLAFGANRSELASASRGGPVRMWNLAPATNSLHELESMITQLAGHQVVNGALVRLRPLNSGAP